MRKNCVSNLNLKSAVERKKSRTWLPIFFCPASMIICCIPSRTEAAEAAAVEAAAVEAAASEAGRLEGERRLLERRDGEGTPLLLKNTQ